MKQMSEGTKKSLNIVNIVMLIAAFVLVIINITNNSGEAILGDAIQLIALICAALYCFFGYKKNVALFYKTFLIGYLISRVFLVISTIRFADDLDLYYLNVTYIGLILLVVACICLIILAFVKDLGKKKSVTLGIIILVASIIPVATSIANGVPAAAWRGVISSLIVAVVINLAILAKYEDKAERGTK